MAKRRKKPRTKVDTTLTLGHIELDIRKAYGLIGQTKTLAIAAPRICPHWSRRTAVA